jgi:hypothetical protein
MVSKGQRRLAGPGDARKHHQAIARDPQLDVLEVVLPRPHYVDFVLAGHLVPSVRSAGRKTTKVKEH